MAPHRQRQRRNHVHQNLQGTPAYVPASPRRRRTKGGQSISPRRKGKIFLDQKSVRQLSLVFGLGGKQKKATTPSWVLSSFHDLRDPPVVEVSFLTKS